MKRAYSILTVKSVDEAARTIEGIATTPTPDRYNDVVVTSGVEFNLPLPFLNQHRSSEPIGNVIAAKATKEGLVIKAQLPAAGLLDYVDTAWAQIKAGLVRGLSIGFRSLEESFDRETGGFRFLRTEIMEISAVTVPANADCTITGIKSYDAEALAASGRERKASFSKPLGVSSKPTGKSMLKSFKKQIEDLEAKRTVIADRMAAMIESAEGGILTDAAEQREYDGLSAECETLRMNVRRLQAHELNVTGAQPVTQQIPDEPIVATPPRQRSEVTVTGPKLEKGIPFARMAIALFAAKGDRQRAAQYCEKNAEWMSQTPELARIMRAAVDVGNTATSGWASQLAPLANYTGDFVDFLRPQTIIGKINGFRMVPFRVSIKRQTEGTEGSWVGEGSRKPIGKLGMDTVELKQLKVAKIVVLTEELVRFSTPSVELMVRNDLAEGIVLAMDKAFIDENNSGSANIKPASVLYGAQTDSASGPTTEDLRTDAKEAFAWYTSNFIPLAGLVWVMQETQAVALSMALNALGQPEFPLMSTNGGTLFGFPVVTSQAVNAGIIGLIKPSEILMADDGQARIDMSNQASVVMDDGGSPESTTMVSFFQENLLGILGERMVNWQLRRDEAAYYITGADYGGEA